MSKNTPNMFRFLFILLLSLTTLLQAGAQNLMRNWLSLMPDSVMPLLTKNNRLDFVDFLDARMEAVVSNRLEGKSRMDTLTDDYLLIHYTGTTDIAMKLLPVNDTADVLCMVTTVKAPVADSRIAFYDAEWQPLEVVDYIHEPSMDDFRPEQQGDSVQWAWSKIDIFFRTYRLDAGNTELKCVLTTPDYLSKEDRKEVVPYLRQEPLIYRWTDGKYQRYE